MRFLYFLLCIVARQTGAGMFLRGDRGVSMSIDGLHCVESCVNCHLRSRNFFCDLAPDSIEDFNR